MSTPNPWTLVPAADYERHMGPEGLDLLAPLSAIFHQAYSAARPARVLVVGCATGNGIEHVDPSITARVVGLDVNLQYLGIARQRFFHLGPRLELYCADAVAWPAPPGSFDLVHAGLVLEHLHPEPLVRRIAGWLADGGTCSVALELPGGAAAAPVPEPLRAVERAKRLVPPAELVRLMELYAIPFRRERTVPSGRGRPLWVGEFGRGPGGRNTGGRAA